MLQRGDARVQCVGCVATVRARAINPFRTSVSFWVQTIQFVSSLSPKRDCGSKRVNPWGVL